MRSPWRPKWPLVLASRTFSQQNPPPVPPLPHSPTPPWYSLLLLCSSTSDDDEPSGPDLEPEVSSSDNEDSPEAELAQAKAMAAQVQAEKRATATHPGRTPRGVVDMMAELDMDKYDDEDGVIDATAGGLMGAVKPYYDNPDADPLLRDDDDSDLDDLETNEQDLLFLAARTEEDIAHLELYVYQDPGVVNEEKGHLYVHHDLMLPAFPLCLAWLDFDPRDPGIPGSFVAVGTMTPEIEIWDLDVLDAIEPVLVLGGTAEEAEEEEEESPDPRPGKKGGKKSKSSMSSKSKSKSKSSKPTFRPGSHEDAVMTLSWTRAHRHVLASGSADGTVKLWDLGEGGACAGTLTHHRGSKVQSVVWCPHDGHVMATGGYDQKVYVMDVRQPEVASLVWKVSADVESIAWRPDPTHATTFLVATEDGMVAAYDAQQGAGSAPLFRLHAHHKATCALSFCPAVSLSGLMVTASTDKTVKFWDISGKSPQMLGSEDLKTGAVFAAQFSESNPYLVAAGGARGLATVFDIRTNRAIYRRWKKELDALADEQGWEAGELPEPVVDEDDATSEDMEEDDDDDGEEEEDDEGGWESDDA